MYGEIRIGDEPINSNPLEGLEHIISKKQDTLNLNSIYELLSDNLDDVEAKRMMHRIDDLIKQQQEDVQARR